VKNPQNLDLTISGFCSTISAILQKIAGFIRNNYFKSEYGGIAQLGAQVTSKTPRKAKQVNNPETQRLQGFQDHGGIAQLGAQVTSKTTRKAKQVNNPETQ